MAKSKTVFTCQKCSAQFPKWEGRCRECGSWNSLVEEVSSSGKQRHTLAQTTEVMPLDQDPKSVQLDRMSTGLGELDRVLGGGLVPGSYVLLGGEPGIGKSTLLLQMAGGLAKTSKVQVLYVSGEESVQQSALRAHRLGIREAHVLMAAESRFETIVQLIEKHRPQVLIVDSIQTVYLEEIQSAPGSVSQVRECSGRLMGLAKSKGIATFLIGHVTKDGHIAGPKVLEHMVDTVLSFEGDGHYQFRLLRALKNRFGATNELGVFQMSSQGLETVANPSELFLEERGEDLTGSAVFGAMEGTRPVLCEIQALCTFSPMAMPRRTSLGIDSNRVHLLAAVLDKHLDLDLSKKDVFVNVVGGLKLGEPSADLAVAAAMISSVNNQELDAKTVFFGEVGLTGEVRAAPFVEERLKEAQKLGFERIVLPASNRRHLKKMKLNIELVWIKKVGDLSRSVRPQKPLPRSENLQAKQL